MLTAPGTLAVCTDSALMSVVPSSQSNQKNKPPLCNISIICRQLLVCHSCVCQVLGLVFCMDQIDSSRVTKKKEKPNLFWCKFSEREMQWFHVSNPPTGLLSTCLTLVWFKAGTTLFVKRFTCWEKKYFCYQIQHLSSAFEFVRSVIYYDEM